MEELNEFELGLEESMLDLERVADEADGKAEEVNLKRIKAEGSSCCSEY